LPSAVVDPSAYETADDDVLKLIVEEADKRVAAQTQLMLAADARASGIMSACIALAAGGLGFAISEVKDRPPFFWAALVFGAFEAIGAAAALAALWPEEVRPQGWSPINFSKDLSKSPERVRAEIAKQLQARIEHNRGCARKLGRRVKAAMTLAVLGPIEALASGLFAFGQPGLACLTGLGGLLSVAWFATPPAWRRAKP